MYPSQPPRSYFAAIFLIFVGLFPAPACAQAQQKCEVAPFEAVSTWSGTMSYTGSGSGTYQDSFGAIYTYNVHQTIQVNATALTPANGSTVQFAGPENATVSVNDQYTVTSSDPLAPVTTTTTFAANGTTINGGLGGGAGLSISPFVLSCGYAFGADYDFPQGSITSVSTGGGTSTSSTEIGLVPWGAPNIPNQIEPPGTATAPQVVAPFPSTGTTLSGSTTFDSIPWDLPSDFQAQNVTVHWTVTWNFTATPRPLDLILTISNYADWRPTGGISETDIGLDATGLPNLLDIQAQLVFKDNQQPTSFPPDSFVFSLPQVSGEPGVTLNFPPPGDSINTADLSFDGVANPFATVSPDGTVATFSSPNGPLVSALLSPHDWGGWATLNVTAKIPGQTVLGHFPGQTVTDILLPKRQSNSVIADAWKEVHNLPVTTPDSDDSENVPVGDGHPGDGFTLYEEYRGFYMGDSCGVTEPVPEGTTSNWAACQHVEGDPTKKDLFIVTEIGAKADAGIELFEAASGINVHYVGLTENEIAFSRIINFNHSFGPHEVDQHALVMIEGMDNGVSEAIGGPGTPAMVEEIDVAPQIDSESVSGSGNDTDSQVYISTIAHEIAHGSNVWHHGELDEGRVQWAVDDAGNIIETAEDLNGNLVGTGIPVTVLPEDADPASPNAIPLSAAALGLTGPGGLTVSRNLWVGNRVCGGNTVLTGGQHSGDQFCFMRYNTASAYIPLNFPNVRFYVTEAPGSNLTGTPQGTGVNFANRQPRPRYYDSDTTDLRGQCRNQLDVNDSNFVNPLPTTGVCPVP